MAKLRTGIYPGTFDPITNGHVDVIKRARKLVDRLIVGVAINAGKGPLFSLDERVQMVADEIADFDGDGLAEVEVRPFEGLLMHFAQACDASVIVRGLRAVSDFDFEFQMAGMNARLDREIETVFLMASENHTFIASRLVKEIALLGGDYKSFVPPRAAKRLAEAVKRQQRRTAEGD
jgi:pantetheine-phosphate adenylyltransferase